MKLFCKVCLWVTVMALQGCATVGQDFVRPTPEMLTLGQSERAEVIAKLGTPREENSSTTTAKRIHTRNQPEVDDGETGLLTRMLFTFINPRGNAADGVSPQRGATVWLWNGKLVGYEYSSSFTEDSTNFREELVGKIDKKRSRESDVRALLGRAGGRVVYPMIENQERFTDSYRYFEWNNGKRTSEFKRLLVHYSRDGVVEDYALETSTKPLPTPPAPAFSPIPIIIPARR